MNVEAILSSMLGAFTATGIGAWILKHSVDGMLARYAKEHEVRFLRLHEKRVDAIADLHRQMLGIVSIFEEDLVIGAAMQDETGDTARRLKADRDRAEAMLRELHDAVLKTNVYFPKHLAAQLVAFVDAPSYQLFLVGREDREKTLQNLVKARETLRKLLDEVSENFRSILGA